MTKTGARGVGEAFRPPAESLPPWLPRRQRIRLPMDVYKEPSTFFLTISTEKRLPWFRQDPVVAYCTGTLREACQRQKFELESYCFMPDHAHILVSTDEENDLVRLVHSFKQKTGWWFRNRYMAGGLKASPTAQVERLGLWQKSYYDHILRRDEDINEFVRYILENPVVAGLTDSVGEYPHTWSRYGIAV